MWWFRRYADGFETADRVADADSENDTKSKVARPIHTPLAIFSKEFKRYIRKAREQRELEADEEPTRASAPAGAKVA
jgi:hypothetical protein